MKIPEMVRMRKLLAKYTELRRELKVVNQLKRRLKLRDSKEVLVSIWVGDDEIPFDIEPSDIATLIPALREYATRLKIETKELRRVRVSLVDEVYSIHYRKCDS